MESTAANGVAQQGNALYGTGAVNGGFTQSQVNAFRISAVTGALTALLSAPTKMNNTQFYDLCLSLSRGVDFALAHHERPSRPLELLSLLKQVFQIKSDPRLQSAIMVLMFSVKNACQKAWFPESDSKELMSLAAEVAEEFCTIPGFNCVPCQPDTTIATVISTFFPKMKIQRMYAYLEVQAGFDAHLIDFLVEKDVKASHASKMSLFVVKKDNMETSGCLISPPKVNFLLNGQGVQNRTIAFVDPGPQMPTLVNHFLRFGSNLLQAVGEFDGNYIIAIAHTIEMPYPRGTDLKDYEQLPPATVDADSEVIEGPSQVSINCPISFKRIKTPVKGHLCKHLTCFDYANFIDINSRRPSWRCPHCNQSVCFTDIRVDKKMVEILKQVGSIVSEIIISSDGSWSAVVKTDEAIQKPENKTSEPGKVESPQAMELVDLDDIDDVQVCVNSRESAHRTHPPAASQHQGHDKHDDSYWSTLFLSTLSQGTMTSSVDYNAHASVAETNSVPLLPMLDSFMVDTPAGAPHVSDLTSDPAPVNLSTTSQLQQSNLGSAATMNEGRRFSPIPQNVRRTPVTVQPLPAQIPASVSQQRWRAHVPSVGSQASLSQPTIRNSLVNVDSHRISWASRPPYSGSQATPPPVIQSQQSIGLNRHTAEQLSTQTSMPQARPHAGNSHLRPAPHLQRSTSTAGQRLGQPSMTPARSHAGNPSLRPAPHLQPLTNTGEKQWSTQPPMTPARPRAGNPSLRPAPHLRLSTSTADQQRSSQPSMPRAHPHSGNPSLRPAPHLRSSTSTADRHRPSQPLVIPARPGNPSLRPAPHLQPSTSLSQSPVAMQNPVMGSNPSTIEQASLNFRMQPVIDRRINDGAPNSNASGTMDGNWQPTSRMRGALTGKAKADMYHQFVNPEMQQTQAARPFSPTAQAFSLTPASGSGAYLSPAQQSDTAAVMRLPGSAYHPASGG